AVLQILSEKRRKDLLAEIKRGVAAELDGPQRAAVSNHLAMMPRADDEEDLVVRAVLRLDRLVDGGSAVDVFLVPEAMDQHHRRFQRLFGEQLVNGLVLPEGVVSRMLDELVPEAELIQAAAATQLAGRDRLHPHVVLVVVVAPPLG